MICKWRHKFIFKIAFIQSKLLPFAAIYNLASQISCPRESEPKIHSFRPISNQEQLKQSQRTTFLNPHIVQTTLQNSPSDLIALSFFLWCAKQPHYFHDKPTFHHMVSVVSNLTRRHGTVKGIVKELESIGCVTKAQTFLLLMRVYWCGNMYDMVLEAFEEMGNYGYIPNTYVRNIVMDVSFKIGRVDVALGVLDEMETPNFLSFNTAVCNLCKLDDVGNVKDVLRRMLMKGYYINPETYSLVMNCLCKFARLDEAFQLLNMMIVLGAPVSVHVWSILIDGLCKSGQIEVAAYLLERMVQIGCSPNIVTCTSLIKGFLESRVPGKAFKILSTMESKGCFPDLVLCNVLIDCLSKMGWYKNAFEVFSSLRYRNLVPDVYTFSSLVSTICLSRQYVLLPLLTSGLAIQPDLVVCNSLLFYFCKAGYPDGAVEFYNDMLDGGFQPDKYTFAAVLSALCRSGRIHEAVNVYIGLIRSQQDVDAHIHTVMVNALIKSGSFQKALNLFRKATAENVPLDVTSYNAAIDGLLKGGQREEAYALFNQMKKMDITPNKHSYNLILSGFCKDRDAKMVKHIMQEMVERKIELDRKTYRLVINILQRSPRSVLASDVFLEAKKLGLLPGVEQVLLVNRHDAGAYTNFVSAGYPGDIVDPGTSSSDDLSDAAVSVG